MLNFPSDHKLVIFRLLLPSGKQLHREWNSRGSSDASSLNSLTQAACISFLDTFRHPSLRRFQTSSFHSRETFSYAKQLPARYAILLSFLCIFWNSILSVEKWF